MQRITFVPGAVVSPAAITIPTTVPDIDLVLAAVITRLPAGMTIPDHPVTGGGGAAAVAFAAGALTDTGAGGVIAHGANVGADPVVAAVATKITNRTLSLDVNTVLGDLLTLDYIEVGERVPVS